MPKVVDMHFMSSIQTKDNYLLSFWHRKNQTKYELVERQYIAIKSQQRLHIPNISNS